MPEALRVVSGRFWTPLAVIRRGVEWLDALGVGDVLDIGSGAGKWCVASALIDRSTRRYIGLEHRAALVDAARALAAALGVDERVSFVHGALDTVVVPKVDAYYLFNPFGENLAPDDEHLDATVELSDARFTRDIAATEALLASAPAGTWALVYHGFGGQMPEAYASVHIDYDLPNVLRLWKKR